MPRRSKDEDKAGLTKVQQARRLLSGRGVRRDDSDDELGEDEYPWDWIYNKEEDVNGRTIIGARHGPRFQCRLGDCVLLKAEGTSQAWVGLICEFYDDEEEGEKVANFMWFSTEKEIRNKEKKRNDAVPVRFRAVLIWKISLIVNRMNFISPRLGTSIP